MGEVETLETRLKNKGYKLTGPRKVLMGILEKNMGQRFSAQEIFGLLGGSGIDFSTVYRNLELMAKEDILSVVQREDGTSSYEFCFDHHHHHLICTDCGATRCIDFCPMESVDKAVWEGFVPQKHRFEIMGICPECAKKS